MKKTGAEMVKFEEKSPNSGSQPKWKETDGSNAKKKNHTNPIKGKESMGIDKPSTRKWRPAQ